MKNLKKYLPASAPFSAVAILVRSYQAIFSPDHGTFGRIFGFMRCRFYPSCSEYTLQALRQYGLFSGGVASLKRIVKCNPFHPGGYDPITNE